MRTAPVTALLDSIAAGPDWTGALCAQTDPTIFFPEVGESAQQAKAICGHCPLQAQCLAEALDDPSLYGVWGGTTERERVRMRVARRQNAGLAS